MAFSTWGNFDDVDAMGISRRDLDPFNRVVTRNFLATKLRKVAA
jgi:hypothetical protein